MIKKVTVIDYQHGYLDALHGTKKSYDGAYDDIAQTVSFNGFAIDISNAIREDELSFLAECNELRKASFGGLEIQEVRICSPFLSMSYAIDVIANNGEAKAWQASGKMFYVGKSIDGTYFAFPRTFDGRIL